MKRYTIGIIFNDTLDQVLLIKKNKPDWQIGKYNFPGGKIEPNESPINCIKREVLEEVALELYDWIEIGVIYNPTLEYDVVIFTATCHYPDQMKQMEEEIPNWFFVKSLPKNIISNLSWLVPFAKNFIEQGNHYRLIKGFFKYR